MAAQLQRSRQSPSVSDQNHTHLLCYVPKVKPVQTRTNQSPLCVSLTFLVSSFQIIQFQLLLIQKPDVLMLSASCFPRMGRPSKITLLDSDGTPALEYKVPKGQVDMVRPRPVLHLGLIWFPESCPHELL